MSAREPGLLAQLVAEPTLAEKALQKVATLFEGNDRMTCHELRVLAIIHEGQGMSPAEIRFEVEAAIQRRRDRVEAARAARRGAADENP